MRTLLPLVVVSALLVGPASGQTAPPAPSASPAQTPPSDAAAQQPTFRTGVELVTLDVGVLDSAGRPVVDLRAPEFSVKVDGEARRVASATLVRFDPDAARRQIADRQETFYTTNLAPPEGRQIIIAVDQVAVTPGSLRPLMQTAARFVDKLSPLDQVAFIGYPEPGPRVSFTTDRLRIKLAMEQLIGHADTSGDTGVSTRNIGVTEAIAIDERRDRLVMDQVVRRECASALGPLREQCERDIESEASAIAQRARASSDQALRGLLQLLRQLALIDGPKTLILLSEGLALGSAADIDTVTMLAGRARAALNILVVDLSRSDAAIGQLAPTEIDDRRRQTTGLQQIAQAARGGVFFAVGTAEGVFERLLSEISAYYVLGIEQRPGDEDDRRRRIDVQVLRRGVTVRSAQAFSLAGAAQRARRSPEDNLRDTLIAPFAISEIPLRVTTFAQQDPASPGKVRLLVAADVGQPGAAPVRYHLAYALVDRDNRVVASLQNRLELKAPGNLPTETHEFVSAAVVDPGVYDLRLAVVDPEGRRGSVIREVSAWKLEGEAFASSDLIVSHTPDAGQPLAPGVEPHVTTDGITTYVEFYSSRPESLADTHVSFELAADADAPALVKSPAGPGVAVTGGTDSRRVARVVLSARALPPGRYVARARVTRGASVITVLSRPFLLEAPPAAATGAVAVTRPAAFTAAVPPFRRELLQDPAILKSMLDIAATRSSAATEAMIEARAGRYGAAALEALSSGDQPLASFLSGLDLLARNQLDQAATQFNAAAGPRREFFPAAFYLGALYAAAGRDRDAAGTWQIALGTEPRPSIAYALAADARLRDGTTAAAIDILAPAYARAPADDELARRLAIAYMATSRYQDALPVLAAYLTRHPTDANLLFAAITAQYELTRAGQVLSDAERGRARTWAAAYRGDDEALVERYLAAMGAR